MEEIKTTIKSVEECEKMTKKELIDYTKQFHSLLQAFSLKSTEYIKKELKDKKCKNKNVWENSIIQKTALKLSYNGQSYQGFATNKTGDNTIEGQLFQVMKKANFIQNIEEADYSRAGRTDKGVSALGNVISLNLRISKNANLEYNFAHSLNNMLPQNIRILGTCSVNKEFNARYACTLREYHYLFPKNLLNIEKMQFACKKFLGIHDFRNFCKINVKNSVDHTREILDINIEKLENQNFDQRFELYVLKVKGKSFLQHQIRCMIFILFQIGNQLEQLELIDDLLNIQKIPRKPNYQMAAPEPLILISCQFENLNFKINEQTKIKLYEETQEKLFLMNIQDWFYKGILSSLLINNDFFKLAHDQQEKLKSVKKKKYTIIQKLQCGPSLEEIIDSLNEQDKKQYYQKRQKFNDYQLKNLQ